MKYFTILFLFAAITIQCCRAQVVKKYPVKKDDNSLLWEITGKGIQPSYLFGTFHLMCKEDIKLGNSLKEIIKNADEIYFEVDMDDMAATVSAMTFMKMKNDTSLSDLYTPEEFNKIERYFKDSLNMPFIFLKTLKPMLLQALVYPKMMACKTMSGMDQALVEVAKSYDKEILGLETYAFQASIFDSIPYKTQASELLKMLDSMTTARNTFDSMLTIYKSQNIAAIDDFTAEEFNTGNMREVLLNNRNRNWVKMLPEILRKKRLFIAVGAGHLGGKDGVIALLRKEGYTVKPIEN